MPRPHNDVTQLINRLKGWRAARERKGLDTENLDDAIEQLTEYRDWLFMNHPPLAKQA